MPCCDIPSSAHLICPGEGAREQGQALINTGVIWLRAEITLGIFFQSINITVVGKPYTKEISELQLPLLGLAMTGK